MTPHILLILAEIQQTNPEVHKEIIEELKKRTEEEKYNCPVKQEQLISAYIKEVNWNKKGEIKKILSSTKLNDENALKLVKSDPFNIDCLISIPQNVLDYLFLKDEPILLKWSQGLAINYVLQNLNKISIPAEKFEAYLINYLQRIPWSMSSCLIQKDESYVLEKLLEVLKFKFNHQCNYNYLTGVKKGVALTQAMNKKVFISERIKDVLKILLNFPDLIKLENVYNFVMLLPELLKSFTKKAKLKDFVPVIISDDKFMTDLVNNNFDFCDKNLRLLRSLGISQDLEKLILSKRVKNKTCKKFKF